jgi:flagellar secretion chaperone FliS
MNAELRYREAAVAGASPLRLVSLLYEQAIEDLRRAIDAQTRRDIEARTRHINHAILVLGHLEATLDKDQGGEVAENLQRFYQQSRSALVEAQFKQSIRLLEQQISFLTQIREAWGEVERATASPQTEVPNSPSPGHWSA